MQAFFKLQNHLRDIYQGYSDFFVPTPTLIDKTGYVDSSLFCEACIKLPQLTEEILDEMTVAGIEDENKLIRLIKQYLLIIQDGIDFVFARFKQLPFRSDEEEDKEQLYKQYTQIIYYKLPIAKTRKINGRMVLDDWAIYLVFTLNELKQTITNKAQEATSKYIIHEEEKLKLKSKTDQDLENNLIYHTLDELFRDEYKNKIEDFIHILRETEKPCIHENYNYNTSHKQKAVFVVWYESLEYKQVIHSNLIDRSKKAQLLSQKFPGLDIKGSTFSCDTLIKTREDYKSHFNNEIDKIKNPK